MGQALEQKINLESQTACLDKVVPRVVWILWLQGFESAPRLVDICVKSWIRKNPGWSVRLLAKKDLARYLGADFCDRLFSNNLSPQKIANIVRIELMARHGGVWVDADCFCARPLEDWIDVNAQSGFFAFRFDSDRWLLNGSLTLSQRLLARKTDRILANWFFAGTPGNHIFSTFSTSHLNLLAFASAQKRNPLKVFKRPILWFLRRNPYLSAKMGHSSFISRFGFFPYYIFHYHFAAILMKDEKYQAIWEQSGVMSASAALKYSKSLGLPVDETFKNDMLGFHSPVYKFHRRRTVSQQLGPQSRFDWLKDHFG